MTSRREQHSATANSEVDERSRLLNEDIGDRPTVQRSSTSSSTQYGSTVAGNGDAKYASNLTLPPNPRQTTSMSIRSVMSWHQGILSAPTLASFGRSTSFPNQGTSRADENLRKSRGSLAQRTASRLFKRRTGQYDDEHKDDMIMEMNGIRVFYDTFSSIDWIHDFVKESVRLRKLRGMKGLRGRLANLWDGMQGWILVFLTGLLTACVAGAIDISEGWLFNIKDGYCQKDWRLKKGFCCADSLKEDCADWLTWSEALEHTSIDNYWIDYIMYILFALLFAITACLLTLLTKSSLLYSKKSSTLAGKPTTPIKAGFSHPQPKVMYFAAGSGIPEVKTILGGFVIRGFLGVRTLFVKAVGLTLSVASGLSLGKEGPFVHIACCVGNILCRLFDKYERNEGKRREILSAACAAGVAVSFGAPIGGVLFSLEEVSYYFPNKTMWRSFFCAMIAAVSLKLIDPFRTGKIVLFQVTYDKDWHYFELGFFLLIGVFGGIYGAVFSKLNILWAKTVRSRPLFKKYPIVEVAMVTAATVVVSFFNRYTKMGGTELVLTLLSECRPEDYDNPASPTGPVCVSRPDQILGVVAALSWALAFKAVLTIVTFGIKVPAGIFIPSMCVGALAGRMVGLGVEWLYFQYPDSPVFAVCDASASDQCILPGIYAMIGAASALAGVTRMTVSLAVIMFELTGTLSYVLPVMLAVMVSKWVADALELEGIYDLVIDLNGLPYLNNKREYIHTMAVVDICEREGSGSGGECIHVDDPITASELVMLLDSLVDSGYALDGGFPLIDKGGIMVGYLAASELEHALEIVAQATQGMADGPVFIKFRTNYQEESMMAIHSGYGTLEMEGSMGSMRRRSSSVKISADPTDFTPFTDQGPVSLSCYSPMELVMELFVKLGCRYVCVIDPTNGGKYVGVIHKKRFLRYLKDLERQENVKKGP